VRKSVLSQCVQKGEGPGQLGEEVVWIQQTKSSLTEKRNEKGEKSLFSADELSHVKESG
jgi:hypothetical protein